MQHYGLSTRLLDFSYNALVALWMAVGDWTKWKDQGCIANQDYDGGVWLMDPAATNKRLGHNKKIENFELRPEYLPNGLRQIGAQLPRAPIALEAPLSNQRIIAQQGCFVCFGTDSKALDEQLGPDFDDIGVIRIPAADKAIIYDQLERIGITDDALFQDLETLGNRLMRHYAHDDW